MMKVLEIDKRVCVYGSKKEIEQAERVLSQVPNLPYFAESAARTVIQGLIDDCNIKADILFDGNTVWSRKRIIKDIKSVKKNGMSKMSDYLYKFLSLSCGSIAHFNKSGWISYYPSVNDLRQFFFKNEFGNRVLDHIPQWRTDVISIVENIEKIL